MAAKAEDIRVRQDTDQAALGPKPKIATGRKTKYLEIIDDTGTSSTSGEAKEAKVAKAGDTIDIHYKVLKLGKHSYNGLSGKGTVVFSRGCVL